jgi:hypothetical protein
MEPSLPAAAEMPAQVQRYFVGKTSAEIYDSKLYIRNNKLSPLQRRWTY